MFSLRCYFKQHIAATWLRFTSVHCTATEILWFSNCDQNKINKHRLAQMQHFCPIPTQPSVEWSLELCWLQAPCELLQGGGRGGGKEPSAHRIAWKPCEFTLIPISRLVLWLVEVSSSYWICFYNSVNPHEQKHGNCEGKQRFQLLLICLVRWVTVVFWEENKIYPLQNVWPNNWGGYVVLPKFN